MNKIYKIYPPIPHFLSQIKRATEFCKAAEYDVPLVLNMVLLVVLLNRLLLCM